MKKDIKNIIYVNTLYSLFLVLIKEPNLDENFYFFDEKIPNKITDKFKNKFILFPEKNGKNKFKNYVKIRFFLDKLLKDYKKKLKDKKFYLNDSLKYSQFFLNNFENKFYVIEDGTINYNEKLISKELKKSEHPMKLHTKLRKKYIYLSPKRFPAFGLSEKILKVYLTGILPIPKLIENKVKRIDIIEYWNKLKNNEKEKILNIFNLKIENIGELLNKEKGTLLVTQPLSEDGIISEKEKIDIYREILIKRKIKDIYIKPHPRERTDYEVVLSEFNIKIIDKNFPIEIFILFNVEFKKIITLFSTGVLNFKDKYDIEFIGTEHYPKLYERFGKI